MQQINESGYPISPWRMDYSGSANYLLRHVGRIGVDGRAVLKLATLRNATIIEEPAS